MSAYLIDHPPLREGGQFYRTRNRALTGCTVLHTAESVMDTVGPDTGAEAVAEFIRRRSDPGSYHDLTDSDSYLTVVPYESGAFHDATGSNNWALSISFACRTSDWRAMSPEKRRGFLRNGARAFAAQQAWRKAHGYPLTELRYITKAQSDAGMSGFIEHGKRDPGRRSDPGVSPPNLFPYDEWLDYCRAALGGTTTPDVQEDDMPLFIAAPGRGHALVWPGLVKYLPGGSGANQEELDAAIAEFGPFQMLSTRAFDVRVALRMNTTFSPQASADISAAVARAVSGADVDEEELARIVVGGLLPQLTAALAEKTGATREDVEEVLRGVLGGLDTAA